MVTVATNNLKTSVLKPSLSIPFKVWTLPFSVCKICDIRMHILLLILGGGLQNLQRTSNICFGKRHLHPNNGTYTVYWVCLFKNPPEYAGWKGQKCNHNPSAFNSSIKNPSSPITSIEMYRASSYAILKSTCIMQHSISISHRFSKGLKPSSCYFNGL